MMRIGMGIISCNSKECLSSNPGRKLVAKDSDITTTGLSYTFGGDMLIMLCQHSDDSEIIDYTMYY